MHDPCHCSPGAHAPRRLAATNLFKLLLKYRPEDKKEKKARAPALRPVPPAARKGADACRGAAQQERLLKKAEAEKDGKAAESKKPISVKFGINHITYLVEQARCASTVHCRCTPADTVDARVSSRARRSWLLLRTTLTRLSWSSGCLRCAAR